MIESIQLINFQNHKNTSINLIKGLNVIVGESDTGKSAVIKAIDWVANDTPSGASMIRDNQKEARVIIKISSDEAIHTIIKIRTKTKTSYILKYQDYTGDVYDLQFEACGRNIPKEILAVLNFGIYNIQNQFEPFFLLNSSPGDVAKELHVLGGISDIDTYTKTIKSHITSVKKSIAYYETEIENNKEKGKDLLKQKDIDIITKSYQHIINNITIISEIDAKIINLKSIKNEIGKCLFNIDNLPYYDHILPSITKITHNIKNQAITTLTLSKLEEIASTISNLKDELEINDNLPKIDELTEILTNISTLKTVEDTRASIEKIETNHIKFYNKFIKLEEIENKTLKSLIKFERTLTTCPTCGGKYAHSNVK